jgi:hypothetical protein
MAAVTKNRKFAVLLSIKMSSNFSCSYMAMSSLTHVPCLAYLAFSFCGSADLNVIFHQNMPNKMHNQYKSAERTNSQKNL